MKRIPICLYVVALALASFTSGYLTRRELAPATPISVSRPIGPGAYHVEQYRIVARPVDDDGELATEPRDVLLIVGPTIYVAEPVY